MINFNFSISNPFRFQSGIVGFDFNRTWQISKNKFFEIQISQFELMYLFDFSINLNWFGSDHAGPEIYFEILGLFFCAKIYDHRHWDYDNQTWEVYEEDSILE